MLLSGAATLVLDVNGVERAVSLTKPVWPSLQNA
jgi:hypothetical protein